MRQFINKLFLIVFASLFIVQQLYAEKLTIAVASNFFPVFESLIDDFKRLNSNAELVMVSGSSGKIYAQVKHGAPFDIFLSADQDKPLKLVQGGLADSETLFTYAIGQLVLWSADSSLISNGSILQKGIYKKLALANAKLAPYGVAAEQVLDELGLLKTSRLKWVQGENISQAYQFVASENAELGFVAKSQVWKNGQLLSGSAWIIPSEMYSPIKQDAVMLSRAKNNELAKKMMHFLKMDSVRRTIETFGYDVYLNNVSVAGVQQ